MNHNPLSRDGWPDDEAGNPDGLRCYLGGLREKLRDDHVTVSTQQLIDLVLEADKALDGINDDERDALYSIRESLADLLIGVKE